MVQKQFDYYYGAEAEQYAFFRIPKVLMTEPCFKGVSTDAKLLYGLLLDRMSLSLKNGWLDEQERVYIYFTLNEVCEQMDCGTDKAVKLFAELDSGKGVSLIERIKQGQGKPARIYVKRFYCTNSEDKNSEKPSSSVRKSRIQDFWKAEDNNTDTNKTEVSNINQAILEIDGLRSMVRENIALDVLAVRYPKGDLDEIVELIVEVLCAEGDCIKIGGRMVNTELAKERMRRLNTEHICYVLDCIDKVGEIWNIKGYLLETLFNASATMGNFYRAKVNRDFGT